MKYYFLALGTLVAVCVGCAVDGQQFAEKGEYHAPPAAMLQRPGPMVDGPGPGVNAMLAPPPQSAFVTTTTQVRFTGPAGTHIGWQIPNGYAENQLVAPGRYNFVQGATYRLKLTGIPDRAGLTLYPTLQVYPAHPSTDAYLSHNSVPVQLTVEDLDQVESNNFVTKVIYLPDAKFQELAIAGVEELVSTRLDPGVDPIAEADKRGTIMAVLRMGNMDLEVPQPAPPGAPEARNAAGELIEQVSYAADGDEGQMVPPMPIAVMGHGAPGVPGAMIVADSGLPGLPAGYPIAGVGGMPMWGHPTTGTPIGLPGPPHIPYGGPASLKSHTVRNLTRQDLGRPVEDLLIDVRHEPGQSLPHPVSHIEYTEKHPVYSPGEVAWPQWSGPAAGAYAPYAPPPHVHQ